MATKDTTRKFSYSQPVRFGGFTYPSAEADIAYDGTTRQGRIFADANGMYHTLDLNGNILDATPVHELDEVTVTAPRRTNLPGAFSRYLTMSNDNTRVNNHPHRSYNTHLKESAERGAKYHAVWDEEHPNLVAWRDAATAVPFGVAAIPFAGGAGEAALGTTLGQAARSGLSTLMSNPIVEAANNAIGLGFAGKGMYDVSQGKFTPETAMDMIGGATLLGKDFNFLDRLLTAKRAVKNTRDTSATDNVFIDFKKEYPLLGEKKIPEDIKQEAVRRYTAFINSKDYQNRFQRANLGSHWQYMKDLTDRRINGKGYFPGKVSPLINGDYRIQGQANVFPLTPNYGITLKENIPKENIMDILMHELSHWATGVAGVSDIENKFLPPFIFRKDTKYIGDIMRYNEGIAPNAPLSKAIQSVLPASKERIKKVADRYYYLIDPQEKRARAVPLYQQAKDANITTDKLVDMYTKNGEIVKYAPEYLRDMGKVL